MHGAYHSLQFEPDIRENHCEGLHHSEVAICLKHKHHKLGAQSLTKTDLSSKVQKQGRQNHMGQQDLQVSMRRLSTGDVN